MIVWEQAVVGVWVPKCERGQDSYAFNNSVKGEISAGVAHYAEISCSTQLLKLKGQLAQ